MQVQINSFNELLELIQSRKFSTDEVTQIIEKSLSVFVCPDDFENIIDNLKTYWLEFGHLQRDSRPMFLRNLLFDEVKEQPTIKKIIEDIEARY